MSQHLSDKKDVDDYFNKKLYIDLGKYKINQEDSFDDSDLKSSFDLTSNVNNGKFTLQNCLSKDLLETLDCFSPINECKKEEIKPDSFNLDETNDNSIWDNKKLLEELQELGSDIFTGFEESELFGEELDEKDNDFLNEIIEDTGRTNLLIKYQCKNLEQFNEIMNFIESIKEKYE